VSPADAGGRSGDADEVDEAGRRRAGRVAPGGRRAEDLALADVGDDAGVRRGVADAVSHGAVSLRSVGTGCLDCIATYQ